MAEALEKSKEPHYVSSRLLKALGGSTSSTPIGKDLVEEGAYLWGVADREKGKGLFNHVLLVSRVALALGNELKKKAPDRYKDLNMRSVFETAILHDISKLYAQDREFLSKEEKSALGIRPDFSETDPSVEEVGVEWLKDLEFPQEVLEAIKDHFPEKIIDDPYWQIGLVADFLTGQSIMPLQERLQDVKTRWIDQPLAAGLQPRIAPEKFEVARKNIEAVANEIFSTLGTTDKEFIETNRLNDPASASRSERFLRQTYEAENEARASRHVEREIG